MPLESSSSPRIARFGVFEADFEDGELRRAGRVVALQEQPLLVLSVLLEHAGQEVSREQLRQRLWPDQAFLDFETGINTAVAKLRQALGDSAENPRFIATRPRHGYRFIAPVSWVSRGNRLGLAAPVVPAHLEPEPTALPSPVVGARVWRHPWLGGVAILILLVGLTVVMAWMRGAFTPRTSGAASLEISAPSGESLTRTFALSPSGKSLVFVASGAPRAGTCSSQAQTRLWLRVLGDVAPRALPGTEDAAMPFWSPDERNIGFFAHGNLKSIELKSGTVTQIAAAPRGRGGSWSRDGRILFAPDVLAAPIFSVAATGGATIPVTDLAGDPSHRFPVFLPDGRHFLYLVLRADRDNSEIRWGEIGSASGGRLLGASSNALFMDSGFLFFARGGALLAQKFDSASLQLIGQPLVVSERVDVYGEEGATGLGAFSVSTSGSVAIADFVRPPLRFSWFDRQGRQIETVGPPGEFTYFDLSPDGQHAAAIRFDPKKRASDLLTLDLRTGVVTQVTDDPWPDSDPVWSPRGDRLAFGSLRDGRWRILLRDVRRGGPDLLLASSQNYVWSWFPDGRSLVVGRVSPKDGPDLWKLPVEPDALASPLVERPGDQLEAQVSPDGRWLSYVSDHEGHREIYLDDLRTRESHPVSSRGGDIARWGRDGQELFYLCGKTVMAVSVRNGSSLRLGQPQRLFEPPLLPDDSLGERRIANFGVAGNGSKFLFAVPTQTGPSPVIHLTLRWSPSAS